MPVGTAAAVRMHPDCDPRVLVEPHATHDHMVMTLRGRALAVAADHAAAMLGVVGAAVGVDVPVERPADVGVARPAVAPEVADLGERGAPAPSHLLVVRPVGVE